MLWQITDRAALARAWRFRLLPPLRVRIAMQRESRLIPLAKPSGIVATCAFIAILLATPALASKRAENEEVVVTGVVMDTTGKGVAGAIVELRGKHRAFSLRDFRVKRRGSRVVRSQTNASGSFEISWLWHPYYDRFELVAGVPLGPPETSGGLAELALVDLSKRMKEGNPVVATLEIENTDQVDSLRDFLAGIDTDDERQVYQEMGKPDKVRHTTLPTHEETSWWYFEQGKVYRFRDGEKESVEQFEPVPPVKG